MNINPQILRIPDIHIALVDVEAFASLDINTLSILKLAKIARNCHFIAKAATALPIVGRDLPLVDKSVHF